MMHILVAPNAFKNSLYANDVAEAIQRGLNQSILQCTIECFPIGDGGDGTGSLIITRCGGSIVNAEVHDPLGRKIKTSFGLIDDGETAVIEMADASGIRLLKPNEFNPLYTSTFGTGELIKRALDMNVRKIILGVGGSATVDGGTGILNALGIRFLNAEGNELVNIPGSLVDLNTIDVSRLDQRILNCKLSVLCDVDNGLLGNDGAAVVFGPQKGATPEDVKKLEEILETFSKITFQQIGKKMDTMRHGGAAGGAAAGLSAFLNAKLVNGIDHFLQLTGFDEALIKSDVVITGEGHIDEQTLLGKGPFGVASRAKAKDIPVIGLAGKVPLDVHAKLKQYFDVLMAIGHEPSSLSTAMRFTLPNLIRTSTEIGNLLALLK